MEEDDQKELQLLPAPQSVPSPPSSSSSSSPSQYMMMMSSNYSQPLDAASIISFRSSSKPNSNQDHHNRRRHGRRFEGAAGLDLQLSISLRPIGSPALATAVPSSSPAEDCSTVLAGPICECDVGDDVDDYYNKEAKCVAALKWEAAEQIRLAAVEKAYAERVRELTRREMELAQSEFARARHMWERAREEVERAERMKEKATSTTTSSQVADSTCMEITCQSCRQRFRP